MSNIQKTPLSRTLSSFTKQVTQREIAKLGLAVPGIVASVNNAFVTINFQVNGLNFPQATMPIGFPEYIRLPIQPGDKGVAIPADFYLNGVSGLGGPASTTQPGNLSALYWVPLSNVDWSTVVSGLVFDSAVTTTGNVTVGNGWTGTFVDLNGQVITVQNGIIVNGQ